MKANSAELPLVIMHMGKERSLNAIPKKLNKNMLDVFDIKLSNFSVLSICTSIFLPEENDISNDLDIHIILVPRMLNKSSPDNVNLTPDLKDSEGKKEHFSEKSAYKEEISTPKITQSQVGDQETSETITATSDMRCNSSKRGVENKSTELRKTEVTEQREDEGHEERKTIKCDNSEYPLTNCGLINESKKSIQHRDRTTTRKRKGQSL